MNGGASELERLLQSSGLARRSELLDSTSREFPVFSIQIHGITDAPYFSGSTRVRVFLAMPSVSRRQSTETAASASLMLYASLHPHGGERADEMAMQSSDSILPILDALQADGSECCGPWFAGRESFAFVDAHAMCSRLHPLQASVVAVVLVDVIDRRTSRVVGCIGGSVAHLNNRQGVFTLALHRSVRMEHDGQHHYAQLGEATLPLTTVAVEVHWGDGASEQPNLVTSKKLRAMMFGAVAIEEHVAVAPCLSSAADVSREDRRRLLYKNATFRSVRPVDIHLTISVARKLFDAFDAKHGTVKMPTWDEVESLGFLVCNLSRGVAVTVHEIGNVEPLPCEGVSRGSSQSSSAVLAPSPSLAMLMLFRVVLEANGVVVGHTTRHDWDASLLHPTFPPRPNTFLLTEDTMMDDDDDDDSDSTSSSGGSVANNSSRDRQQAGTQGRSSGATATGSIRTRRGNVSILVGDDDNALSPIASTDIRPGAADAPAFQDMGEMQAVTCVVRVFAMVPNYKRIAPQPLQGDGGGGGGGAIATRSARSNSANASLLSRLGFGRFEPMNPSHYQVIPYGWGVFDVVAPSQPFIKCRQHQPVTLYRGRPPEDVLTALRPLTNPSGTSDTLDAILGRLRADKKLPPPMKSTLTLSVMDASLMHSSEGIKPRRRAADASPSDGVQFSLGVGWLGAAPECTTEQLEECLEATFRAFIFE